MVHSYWLSLLFLSEIWGELKLTCRPHLCRWTPSRMLIKSIITTALRPLDVEPITFPTHSFCIRKKTLSVRCVSWSKAMCDFNLFRCLRIFILFAGECSPLTFQDVFFRLFMDSVRRNNVWGCICMLTVLNDRWSNSGGLVQVSGFVAGGTIPSGSWKHREGRERIEKID